jgi:hypothetical protein
MPHVVGLRPAYLAATVEGGEPALAVGVGGGSGMRVGCSVGSAAGSTLFGVLLVVVDVDNSGASLAVVETGGAPRGSVAVQAASAPRGTAARKARRSTVAHRNGGRWYRQPTEETVGGRWQAGLLMTDDVLERFSLATAAWFRGSFSAPTAAQVGAWEAISSGRHALVVAPTGSGKTLSAFLWALDRLASGGPPASPEQRCRVLYVSPLKALAVDVERNLRSPLVGIGHAAARLGQPMPDIRVAVRSGDTPAADRRAFAKAPADILITTPESLFLMLTSGAREALTGVETVIVDEVHAVAGTKRGAHLALSLERLDQLLPRAAQRVGLSATVRPVEEVARFLAGGRPVDVVQPPSTKEWDLEVVVPLADMSTLGEVTRGPQRTRGGRAAPGLHLATRRGAHRRSRRGAPVDARVRELAAARRTAHRPAQRDLGRTARRGRGRRRSGSDHHRHRQRWSWGTCCRGCPHTRYP